MTAEVLRRIPERSSPRGTRPPRQEVPMASAVWCWEAARIRAFESRVKALDAAKRGDGAEAIRLTADAQKHDRIADDWRAHVPEWQWKIYWDYKRGEECQQER